MLGKKLRLVSVSFITLVLLFSISAFSVFASSNADLEEYPDFFGKDGFNGLFVVGTKAKGMDIIAMTNVLSGVQGYFDQSFKTSQVNVLDSEANLNNDIISFGTPCVNTVTAEIVGSVECDYLLDEDKVAVIIVKDYKNYKHLVAYGIEPRYAREISMVLREFNKYDLEGTEYYIRDADYVKVAKVEEPVVEEEVELLENETMPETIDNLTEELIPVEIVNKTPECVTSVDCEDSNACTVNSCVEGECLVEEKTGCNYEGQCLDIGTVVDTNYCSNEMDLTAKKGDSSSCTKSYECNSGLCENEICKKIGTISKIVTWFKNLFS